MIEFCTKTKLYERVESIRSELGIGAGIPIFSLAAYLHYRPSLKIAAVPFETTSLHGMCSFGENGKADVILLNSYRRPNDQNFDLAHEFIHIHEHRDGKRPAFCCYEKVTSKQDSRVEWQANEGAAQLLVPFQDFIPRFVQFSSSGEIPLHWIPSALAEYYHVSTQVINLRLENLGYEIDQYRNGVPIDRIQLLSHAQQRRMGICPTSYLAMCEFALSWDSVIR